MTQRVAGRTRVGLTGPFRELARHRHLVALLVRRDIRVRTSGTVLGGLWMVLQPALQVLAFWFLLDFVLRVRFPGAVPFRDYFLVGMIPWLMISEILLRSLSVLPEFAALYQRAAFPLSILPVLPALVSGAMYAVVYTLVVALLGYVAVAAVAPLLVAAVCVWLVPLCYLFSLAGLFARDSAQVIRFLVTLTMYVTPILYLPQMLPPSVQPWLVLNPFADLMAVVHALVQGMPLSWGNFTRLGVLWVVLLVPAWTLFLRSEPHMRETL